MSSSKDHPLPILNFQNLAKEHSGNADQLRHPVMRFRGP
jgi:hypothetical protein